MIRIPNTDPPKYNYHWGIRAVHEVSPREALTFASEVCNFPFVTRSQYAIFNKKTGTDSFLQMYNRENIQSWAAHYKAVEEFEKKG